MLSWQHLTTDAALLLILLGLAVGAEARVDGHQAMVGEMTLAVHARFALFAAIVVAGVELASGVPEVRRGFELPARLAFLRPRFGRARMAHAAPVSVPS